MRGASINLRGIARALGGEIVGQQVLCPGPGHSAKDRSLSVRLSIAASDGFVVFSHAGDDFAACRDHVARLLGIASERGLRAVAQQPERPAEAAAAHRDCDAEKVRRALAIWRESTDPTGSVVEHCLASRRLNLTRDLTCAPRFHPACPWRDEASGSLIRVPAMIAAFRNIVSDEITGVHRTRLSPDGQKLGRRMLGIAAGAAIKLDGDTAVTHGLVVGEGIETCLAARQMGLRPIWAMGSVGGIATLPVLAAVDALTFLEETGDSGASARAIEQCGARWHSAGREVVVVRPRVEGDLNDALKGAAA